MRGRQRTVGKQSGNAEVNTAIAMYMPSSLQDHLRDPPAWTKAFLRTFGCGIANHFKKETKKHEHTCNRADRGCCSVRRVRFLGRWPANKWGIDPKAKTPAVEFNDGKGLCADQRLDGIQSPVLLHRGRRPVTGAIQAAAFGWLPVLLWC